MAILGLPIKITPFPIFGIQVSVNLYLKFNSLFTKFNCACSANAMRGLFWKFWINREPPYLKKLYCFSNSRKVCL